MIADAQAPKRQSEVESAKQRLEKAIAMATESFALLRTRLVPVMCPSPCAFGTEQEQEPEAVPLVGDLNAMTRSVEQLNSRIQSANEELEL